MRRSGDLLRFKVTGPAVDCPDTVTITLKKKKTKKNRNRSYKKKLIKIIERNAISIFLWKVSKRC